MKKKTTKKVTILQAKPKFKPFDLKTDKDNERIVNAYMTLQATEGWVLFTQMIKSNIKVIEEQILSKRDIKGVAYTEAEVDRLREKRDVYIEMIELPNKTVQESFKSEDEEENPDPYYNKAELRRHRQTNTKREIIEYDRFDDL